MNEFVGDEEILEYVWELPKLTADGHVILKLALLHTDDVTVAQLTSPPPHHSVVRGSAKRHSDDTPDISIGTSLAVARALRKYADTLEKSAYKRSRAK